MTEEKLREIIRKVYKELQDEKSLAKRSTFILMPFVPTSHISLPPPTEKEKYIFVFSCKWNAKEKEAITRSYQPCQIFTEDAAANLPLEGSLTVYPVLPRSLLAEMALGLTHSFASKWFERCLAAGSKVEVVLAGCERFTGQEPRAYVQKILGYLRILLTYDVHFTLSKKINTFIQTTQEIILDTKIITVRDLANIPHGSIIKLRTNAILTSAAAEWAERHQIIYQKVLEGR